MGSAATWLRLASGSVVLAALGVGALAGPGCFLPDYEKVAAKPTTITTTSSVGGGGSGQGGSGQGGGQGGQGGTIVGCADDASGPDCAGNAGPPMVRVPIQAGGSYCVDTTEVTNTQYDEFLQSMPDPQGPTQPDLCKAFNASFTPNGWNGPPAGKEGHPVVNVDWCDAAAYCRFAGKRLCGKVGGGPAAHNTQDADPINEQWYRACSIGGHRIYPYTDGDGYEPKACNGKENSNGTVPTGSIASCEGGHCGLYDMAGNVSEWVDMCDGETGDMDKCLVLGGNFQGVGDAVSCIAYGDIARASKNPTVGFRCCKD